MTNWEFIELSKAYALQGWDWWWWLIGQFLLLPWYGKIGVVAGIISFGYLVDAMEGNKHED
jgi:hypothetical protein